ncbi:hypothetical protein Q5P01_016280 [Channa striata]|uniref:Uncharacterized protein n=1 Tax=Channa striata TaxID=64152 RepID=A0AA88SGC7_CHASR|nr:hypothetical protein Q5P01_016280 [Channa striata]
MERQEAGQEEKLVVEFDTFGGVHPPRDAGAAGSCRCCKCVVAVAAVMGLLLLTLSMGFSFYYFLSVPSCEQEAPSLRGTGRVNITCKLNGTTGEKGRYDIFIVNKAAKYRIYGWVKLAHITSEDVILRTTHNQDNRILEKKKSFSIMSFFVEALLANNNTISIYFNSSCTDSLFHVLEL